MDQNQVVGTPKEREVWLAPDWSTYEPVSKKQPSGYTRVKVRDTTYADGRIVTVVLDESGQPVGADGQPTSAQQARVLEQQTDPDQQRVWQQQQSASQRQTDQSERRRVSVTYEGAGKDRKKRTTFESGPDLVEDAPEATSTAAAADPSTSQGRKAAEDERESQWNQANGGLYETHARRREREAKETAAAGAAAGQTRVNPNDTTRVQRPDPSNPGQWVDAGPNDAEVQRRAAAAKADAEKNAPKPVQAPGGQWGYWDTSDPNTPTWKPIQGGPQAEQKPVQVGGRWGVWKQDPNGGAPRFEPVQGLSSGAEPAGAPAPDDHYGAAISSLRAYSKFINDQVEAGNLTPEQGDALIDRRLADSKAMVSEQQGVVNTQTGIYGQQLTAQGQQMRDTESRRNAANGAYATVLGQFAPLLKYMPAGGGQAFLDLLAHGVGAIQQNATNWGGMATTPAPTPGPAAAAAARAPMPGSGPAPTAAPVAPPTPPTQGTFLAPYDPAAEAAQQAAIPQANAASAAQPMPAQPPVVPAPAFAPATVAPAGLPMPADAQAAANAGPVPGQDGGAWQPPAPIINSVTGQPAVGADYARPGDPSYQQPFTAPPSQYGDGGAVPVSFLSPYQRPAQQPPTALHGLIADEWMPNHIVAQAFKDVYGYDLPGLGG